MVIILGEEFWDQCDDNGGSEKRLDLRYVLKFRPREFGYHKEE